MTPAGTSTTCLATAVTAITLAYRSKANRQHFVFGLACLSLFSFSSPVWCGDGCDDPDDGTVPSMTKGSYAAFSFLFFFSLISLIANGPHHYHPACGHKGSSRLSPVHALEFFYRDASSALLQLVNQWLNFTYSRSHAFCYERKNTNPTLVRIELTTSALAGVQVTY